MLESLKRRETSPIRIPAAKKSRNLYDMFSTQLEQSTNAIIKLAEPKEPLEDGSTCKSNNICEVFEEQVRNWPKTSRYKAEAEVIGFIQQLRMNGGASSSSPSTSNFAHSAYHNQNATYYDNHYAPQSVHHPHPIQHHYMNHPPPIYPNSNSYTAPPAPPSVSHPEHRSFYVVSDSHSTPSHVPLKNDVKSEYAILQ